MNCDGVKNVLDAHAANALHGSVREEVAAHLRSCNACQDEYVRIMNLIQTLRSVSVPEPSAGFEARLIRNAKRQVQRQRARRVGTGLAAAAVLVAGIAIGVLVDQSLTPGATGFDSEVTITAGTVNTVELGINAGHLIQDVEFVLKIPPSFHLQGHEGQHIITWTDDLHQGNNLLKLNLVGRQGSSGVLVVTLRHGEKHRMFKLKLRANGKDSKTVPVTI